MHLYDKARELAQMIRQSDEMKKLLDAWDTIEKNPDNRDLLATFRNQQMKLQNQQMMGKVLSEQEVDEYNRSIEAITQVQEIRLYLEAESKLGMLMGEINRILSEPLEAVYRDPEVQ